MPATDNADHCCVYFTALRLHFDRALRGNKSSFKLLLHFTDSFFQVRSQRWILIQWYHLLISSDVALMDVYSS